MRVMFYVDIALSADPDEPGPDGEDQWEATEEQSSDTTTSFELSVQSEGGTSAP